MIQRITCYLGTGTEPYENLAVERFLMEAVEEGELILYLWQNRRTVAMGRCWWMLIWNALANTSAPPG